MKTLEQGRAYQYHRRHDDTRHRKTREAPWNNGASAESAEPQKRQPRQSNRTAASAWIMTLTGQGGPYCISSSVPPLSRVVWPLPVPVPGWPLLYSPVLSSPALPCYMPCRLDTTARQTSIVIHATFPFR
jgi:hypothetical protein